MFKPNHLASLVDDPWNGSAIYDYAYGDLLAAGLRDPLTGTLAESRDHPARFYAGRETHPYVRFKASEHYDDMLAAAGHGNAVILVTLGSYAPMHAGHLSLVAAADAAIREQGEVPIAAVFSLHSEEHVRAKVLAGRPDALVSTDARLSRARQVLPKVLDSGTPTFIDEWAARMDGGPVSPFDIMRRLLRTMESVELRNVTPIAVFGSDNGISMRSFCRYGRAVCVRRPRHEEEHREFADEPQMRTAIRERRVLLATRPNGDDGGVSSSDIRQMEGSRL